MQKISFMLQFNFKLVEFKESYKQIRKKIF